MTPTRCAICFRLTCRRPTIPTFPGANSFSRNNNELVATYGNLVNRVLTFTYKNFEGKVPVPAALDDADREIQSKARETIAEMDANLGACKFKMSILRAMELAQAANRYLDEKAPWKTIKTDKQAAATSLYVALTVITQLKNVLLSLHAVQLG